MLNRSDQEYRSHRLAASFFAARCRPLARTYRSLLILGLRALFCRALRASCALSRANSLA
jgi:hypothetical protein